MCKKGLLAMAMIVAGFVFSPMTLGAYYDGVYFNGFVGVSKALNNSYKDGAGSNRYGIKSDHGFNIGGAVGYRYDCFRAEIGLAYTKNDDDRIDVTYNGTPSATAGSNTGDQKAFTLMLNGYYDFVNRTGFVPFIGAGIGAAYIDHDYFYSTNSIRMHESDIVFAYQFIVGLGTDITENLRISLDYRFIGTTDGDFRMNDGGGAMSAGPMKVKGNYFNHQINLGLTYFL